MRRRAGGGDRSRLRRGGACGAGPRASHLAAAAAGHTVLKSLPPRPLAFRRFFRDPSGNALEFKAMTTPSNLFARYVVD